jgi:2-dehydropantoate 2-reductase
MKIYILGSGGIGGYFGSLLAKAGLDVTFIARGDNFKAIKDNGLIVKSVIENFEIKPAKVIEHISEIVEPDLIIYSVKTYDTENVAKELSRVANRGTVILTFQNGVDNDFQIKKFLPHSQVYPGVAYVITAKTHPGLIEQTGGLRKLVFGDRENPQNPLLKNIEKMMKAAGINAILSADITLEVWKKFIFILPFAGLTALYRKTIGEVLSNPITELEYENCLNEAISVAKAKGINLSNNSFEEVMTASRNTASSSKSSLLLDIENNRKNEIDTLNGTLVKLAKQTGISVPVNTKIYQTIKSL